MHIVVAFSVLPVEQVHLRVIAVYENENQATVDLGDHVKRALCDYGNASAVIYPQVDTKNDWKNLKNGTFFGQVDGEREISIWRKYGKPGRLYGETPKRKLVETFRCISHDGSIIVFPRATPVLKVPRLDEKCVHFGNVLVELQEKLNKKPTTNAACTAQSNVPMKKRARKTTVDTADFLNFVEQVHTNPLSVSHEYYVQPKRVKQKYVTEQTADKLISDIFAQMQEETKVHFDNPLAVADEEFLTPCPINTLSTKQEYQEVLSDSWPPSISLLNGYNRQDDITEVVKSYQTAVNEFQEAMSSRNANVCFDGYYDW